MEHITDIELTELAAQRLGAQREKAVLSHVENCPACSRKLAQLRQTWDVLGQWQVQPPRSLDIDRLRALAAERGTTGRTVRLPMAGTLLRVAASVAVAVLVGYAAGRWSLGSAQTTGPSLSPSYVSALGLDAGESLSSLVLDDETTAAEGS